LGGGSDGQRGHDNTLFEGAGKLELPQSVGMDVDSIVAKAVALKLRKEGK